MPECSPRGSRHPKSSGSSSLAITIRDMPAKPRLMRLPDGSRPTSARLRFTYPPILGPTGMMYTGYSSTPLLMQADQFQTRLIRDREGCKNEWHVVVKSGAACAGCDVPARSPQKPWPGSSPSERGSTRCPQSLPRQGGPAESHGRTRRCACRRAGGGRHGREPEGRGSTGIRGPTPCKTNWPCTSAGGGERGQETAALAGQRRCRTAAAVCTAGCPRAPRRVTQMLSSTDTIRLKQSRVGARLRSCYGTRGLL